MPAAPDPEKPITFWSAVSLGVGAMIGAGIFALLGEAGTIAGNAVYLSFIAGGLIGNQIGAGPITTTRRAPFSCRARIVGASSLKTSALS